MTARVNGIYKGTVTSSTEFSKGDSVELLVNGTNYIGTILPAMTMGCGSNSISAELYKLDGVPTVKIFGSAGDQLTDSATSAAINESSSADPIVVEIKMTTPSDEAIDDMVFVLESSNNSAVREMTLSSSTASVSAYDRNKPDFHSQESSLTDSLFRSFQVSNVANDGGQTTFSLLIEPESGETIGTGEGTGFYVTWYVADSYVDTDGTFQVGIEDSDGTAKHIGAADGDYDFLVGVQT